jgi:selenocysteine-specific elongation factor
MLRDSHADDIAAREIALAGRAGTTLAGLARLTGLLPDALSAQLRSLPVVGTRAGLVVSKEGLADVMADIARLLATLPAGLAIEPLRKRLPGTGTAVLDEALRRLIAEGQVAKRGDRFVLPNPDADSAREQGEAARAAQVAETLRKGGLTPPRPEEIQTGPAERAAVARLLRDGTIIRAVDRAKGKEILFHSTAIDQARTTLAPLLADSDGLLVSEICAALGISRKFAMPLLDHLDTIRFTRRVDDRRTLHAMARALPERI